ncbi:hypothetical protein OHA77_28630 [Streptosporangium sp. NBC_01639]|uniref:hypothetical protein n=1 Tax=unclassified Streptosporangium TaxID=2632669 RepID=UPI002DDC8B3F|nr:hypothetical protein [Streptosporangium sp. NBC_01756]WSC88706.1 hypothetical protein OIE48_11120 [Streptosporangium sp. NBC_01756]WTD52608.1 hypothetical protein OHA77_28630 [Streptosporangium sp. NBC_01639]
MTTKRVTTAATALCAAATAALALVAASPASAGETTYHGCKAGNVCLYNGNLTEDYLSYQTPGNVPDGKWFWVLVNNGREQPGGDHVYFEYQLGGTSTWYSKCLHFYPGSGFKLDLRDGAVPAKIRNMYWGGEC